MLFRSRRVPERAYTDLELETAIAAITDPGQLRDAQDVVMRAAPSLQRVLAAAIEPDPDARVRAVRTLLAEETRLGMLVGVAVGFELSRALSRADAENEQEN